MCYQHCNPNYSPQHHIEYVMHMHVARLYSFEIQYL